MSETSSHHHSIQNSSLTDNSSTSVIAKIRRLKMQEKLLFSSINIKSDSKNMDNQQCPELKRNILLIKLKNNYEEIKSLFEDIKYSTNSQDIHNIEVEQVKKDVLSLENKIVNLKRFLNTEMNNLKLKEEELMKGEMENKNIEEQKPRKITFNKTKSFNDIVPSPVKNIINTPHKYKEVQQLQDFIKNNGGKNGGWFEYNHNLFVKTRHKYFNEITYDKTEYETSLALFIEDLQLRIIGISPEKIKEHEKWYLQYLELRKAQQEVLNKWRNSRSQMRSAQHYKSKQEMADPIRSLGRKTSTKYNDNVSCEYITNNLFMSNENYENQENENKQNLTATKGNNITATVNHSKTSFMKTTKGWQNRCLSKKEMSMKPNMNLNNIPKYGIPGWRQNIWNIE